VDLQRLKIDRASKPTTATRSRRSSPWFWRLAILALVAALLWLFRLPLQTRLDNLRLPRVSTYRVVASHPAAVGAVRGTAANGYIVAARRAALSADTPGRIVEMNVTEGSVVREGDVVARLYADEVRADLERAAAALVSAEGGVRRAEVSLESDRADLDRLQRNTEAARADLAEARASLHLAQLDLERSKRLVAERFSSQSELDRAQADVDGAAAQVGAREARLAAAEAAHSSAEYRLRVAEADLEVARSGVVVARADRDRAQATLDKTEVRAPFDGIVVLKDAEVGEVVSPNSQGGSNARGSVCTLVDFDSLEVQADVPETTLAAVEAGAPARIFLDAYPDRVYAGRVDRIWPTANRQKATVEVRVAFEETDEWLRPEMGVRVVFGAEGDAPAAPESAETPRLLLIPESALVIDGGTPGVFLLERDVVYFHPVQPGETKTGRVSIESGLEAGQLLVRDPPPSLRDGDRVQIQEG